MLGLSSSPRTNDSTSAVGTFGRLAPSCPRERTVPYRFTIHSNDHAPPHVHLKSADGGAAFTLAPVGYRDGWGYTRRQLTRIEEVVRAHEEEFLRRWHDHFGE